MLDNPPTGDDKTPDMDFIANMRWAIRRAQLRLLENPDETDPWWFLVDPDAVFTP